MQIIVPIYNAYDVVKPALLALKKHNLNDDVLLINDASTDHRIKSLLNDMPSHWQVRHNQDNMGFVKTANIGLRNSSSHSILLNSDTLVTSAWLDRFKQATIICPDIGTATPWSNNAEICSLPETLKVNPVPDDIDDLATQLAQKHQPLYPELPTAVGFCMLISAAAKQQVGLFDESTFGWGYGEENDYSLRVSQAGLRNVLVDNCYVAHIGNQSFKEKDLRPNEETMQRLLKKHPDYLQLIQKFIEKDPLATTRKSIIAKIGAF
ncbi:glycosyltransferase [Marinicella sp. S1101]|uniref:glycosyltransferase family 2 protein n=1 Tax=Marinicella marina TaxID=2996016 RepID=UPI002260A2D6|nr:glycosyltransferase [Marinicella marina]MCX7552647.1 glycosyltransferase [Marinicella marina]MDJ1139523.1 glycosyltransferase [Marinicella marina]